LAPSEARILIFGNSCLNSKETSHMFLKNIFWLSALEESLSFCLGASQKKSIASSIRKNQIPCFYNLLTSHSYVCHLQFPAIATGLPMSQTTSHYSAEYKQQADLIFSLSEEI